MRTSSGGGTNLTGIGTDNRIMRWNGTDTAQSSGWTISDTDDMSVGALGDKLILDADGDTYIVCDGDDTMDVYAGGAKVFTANASLLTMQSAGLNVAGQDIRLSERSAVAGVANVARVWAQDNGAGKTQLMVIFGTGSAIQLAIEV